MNDVSSKDVSRLLVAIANQTSIIMDLIEQNNILIRSLIDDDNESVGGSLNGPS